MDRNRDLSGVTTVQEKSLAEYVDRVDRIAEAISAGISPGRKKTSSMNGPVSLGILGIYTMVRT